MDNTRKRTQDQSRHAQADVSGPGMTPARLDDWNSNRTRKNVEAVIGSEEWYPTFEEYGVPRALWNEFLAFLAMRCNYEIDAYPAVLHPTAPVHEVWKLCLQESILYHQIAADLGLRHREPPLRLSADYKDPAVCAVAQLRMREVYYGLWPPSPGGEVGEYAPPLNNRELLVAAGLLARDVRNRGE